MDSKLICRITAIMGILGYVYLIYALMCGIDKTLPCMFYELTGYPCPSCGLTRAMGYFFYGNIADGLRLNPLSIIVAIYLLLLPVLGLIDLSFGKNYFRQFSGSLFRVLNTPAGAVTLLLIILLNWLYLIFYSPL